MKKILSILMPTLVERREIRSDLVAKLRDQIAKTGPKLADLLILEDDRQNTTGLKRNRLLDDSTGLFVAFVDDDDNVSDNYVREIVETIDQSGGELDCVGIVGEMIKDGDISRFIHSINVSGWYDKERKIYFRFPNHLNPVRREIAVSERFPETSYAEDRIFSDKLRASGRLKREILIGKEILYYYRCRG